VIRVARTPRWVVCLLTAFLTFLFACPGFASEAGDAAVLQVGEESYRHFLDDMLYTHDGDDRGYGPEHDLAQANIASLMEDFGFEVTLESFGSDRSTYYNVVATKVGTVHPDQEYLIGAHYDSVNNPGADDNASGVALILEAARVLGAYESAYTIRLIAFDREEVGLVGSTAYVAAHQSDEILGMISADMVSYNLGTNLVNVYCDYPFTQLQNAITHAVDLYGDGLNCTPRGPSGGSDHIPFQRADIQSCLLIEDWGNPYYHTPRDSVDTPDYIDYAFATRVTRSLVGYLVDQAGVLVDFPDCNENGIFDFNDIRDGASEDCDENVIPDECEITRSFLWASPELTPLHKDSPQSYTIDSPPEAFTDVTLSFTAYADLGFNTEFVEVWINDVAIATGDDALFMYGAADCGDPPDFAEIILTAEEFNAFVAQGEVRIDMVPSAFVSQAACTTPSYIAVVVEYLGAPTLADCNSNFVPDNCEEPGDRDGDGLIGLGDHAFLEECWSGPCGGPFCEPTPYADPCCTLLDYDRDGDYDLADFAAVQREMSGP